MEIIKKCRCNPPKWVYLESEDYICDNCTNLQSNTKDKILLEKDEVKALLKFLEHEWLDRHNELGIKVVEQLQKFVGEN